METKRLQKYNKNENKLYLKEDVEKSTKTRGKEHRRLTEKQYDGFKKEAELLFLIFFYNLYEWVVITDLKRLAEYLFVVGKI